MSDGGSGGGLKQFAGEMKAVTMEVAKDTKDVLGQTLEQAAQSVTGNQLTPQQQAQIKQLKEVENQKKLIEARRKIEFWKKLEAEQKAIREAQKQKVIQGQQQEAEKTQVQQFEIIQKNQQSKRPGAPVNVREDIARSQGERRVGRGSGG